MCIRDRVFTLVRKALEAACFLSLLFTGLKPFDARLLNRVILFIDTAWKDKKALTQYRKSGGTNVHKALKTTDTHFSWSMSRNILNNY